MSALLQQKTLGPDQLCILPEYVPPRLIVYYILTNYLRRIDYHTCLMQVRKGGADYDTSGLYLNSAN